MSLLSAAIVAASPANLSLPPPHPRPDVLQQLLDSDGAPTVVELELKKGRTNVTGKVEFTLAYKVSHRFEQRGHGRPLFSERGTRSKS